MEDLEQKLHIFSSENHIIVSGGSAGGVSTFHWVNYIAEKAQNSVIKALPITGIFLDMININKHSSTYKQSLKNLMDLSNI